MQEKIKKLEEMRDKVKEAKVNAMKLESELNDELKNTFGIKPGEPSDVLELFKSIVRIIDETKKD